MAQQPTGEAESLVVAADDSVLPGLSSCGINAAFNGRHLMLGFETQLAAPRSTRRGATQVRTSVPSDWIRKHMSRKVTPDAMEQARGSGMRYLLKAIYEFGNPASVDGTQLSISERLRAVFHDDKYALLSLGMSSTVLMRVVLIRGNC